MLVFNAISALCVRHTIFLFIRCFPDEFLDPLTKMRIACVFGVCGVAKQTCPMKVHADGNVLRHLGKSQHVGAPILRDCLQHALDVWKISNMSDIFFVCLFHL
jgi:hypothetical protein